MNDSQSGVKEICQQLQREKFQKCITSKRAQKNDRISDALRWLVFDRNAIRSVVSADL